MNNDGRMDQLEFSIAMKLIKLKLQGYQLPSALPPAMKQPPIAISTAPGFGKSRFILPLSAVNTVEKCSSFHAFNKQLSHLEPTLIKL